MGNDLNHRRGPVVAVVQARMSSTRLPGKVLADVGGCTVLELVLRRLSRARRLDAIVVATSTDRSDDPVLEEAQRLGFEVVRGSSHDVLGRYVDACNQTRAEGVVRITADCPLIDPDVTDQVVRRWHDERVDYASNIAEPRSYPDGLDVEAITSSTLRRADRLAGDPATEST
jgi:spore coat polysaccharide biosynthesis protein SpsF (cytidylyltransferase family)